jgi:HSP20 family protein
MNPVRYNQFATEVPAYFRGMMDGLFHDSLGTALKQFHPAADFAEDEKCYEIQLAVPGSKKEDFKINFIDGKLTI